MRSLRRLITLSLSLGSLLPASAQQPAGANPLNDLLTMQMNWDAFKSDDNAKPSIPLRFVSYEKHKQDGKSFTSYYVYANGLSQNQPYTLISWQIGWDAQRPDFHPAYSDLYINKRGVVMCRKPTETEMNSDAPDIDSEARVNVISAGSLGEPVRYALMSDQAGIVAMGRLVVNPTQADDKPCHLQAILAVGGGEILLVEGTGFPGKSAVELTSLTSGKPQTAKFKTDENGRLETAVVVVKPGETKGTASITMKSDSCAPTVKVNWGKDTYQVE